MSRLAQRLGKLEQIQTGGQSDFANLNDEELLARIIHRMFGFWLAAVA